MTLKGKQSEKMELIQNKNNTQILVPHTPNMDVISFGIQHHFGLA